MTRARRVAVIGLVVALAVAGVLLRKRFYLGTAPLPAAVRVPRAVGGLVEYDIVGEYPHDTDAYTQGLIYLDGYLYESTGRTGRSSVRKVRLETGEVIQRYAVNRGDFGEGLTDWRGRLVQLTPRRRGSDPPWHLHKLFENVRRHFGDNVGVTYDAESLRPLSTFKYPGEGWGITHDEHRIIMSDGSWKLRFVDPETFVDVGSLEVFDGDKRVDNLNELEYVRGKIYANVLPQDRIAIIQPDTGQVIGWIDLTKLRSRMPELPAEPLKPVMNGIAYDASGGRLFVTGKFWPKVFQIRGRRPMW